MTVKPIFPLIFAAATLVGCAATQHWENPGNPTAALDTDKAQCHWESQKASAGRTYDRTIAGEIDEAYDSVNLERACMAARGWQSVENKQ